MKKRRQERITHSKESKGSKGKTSMQEAKLTHTTSKSPMKITQKTPQRMKTKRKEVLTNIREALTKGT